jgi:predicted Zn-dependent peptidase
LSKQPLIQKTTLDNGVRVLTENLPWLKSASLGLWVNHGSRFESKSESGLAHFIEHMVFKGTTNRSCFQITRDIEKTGGMVNAFTSRENLCYQSHFLTEDLATSVDVITDVVLRPTFDSGELEQERKVIIQEIYMTEDDPEDFIEEKWFLGAFPDQAFGRSILGTEDNLIKFNRDDLINYHTKHYQNEDLLYAVVGNVDHNEVCDLIEKSMALGSTRGSSLTKTSDVDESSSSHESASFKSGYQFIDKDLEQVMFLSSFGSSGYHDDLRFVGSILNIHLGGGMSSKLFQEIREKRGLAYSVGSSFTTYKDIGLFDFYLGTDSKKLSESQKVLSEIKDELTEKGITEDELKEAKKMLKGALLIVEDEPEERMSTLALSELRFNRNITLEEVIDKINSVSLDQINEFSKNVFKEKNSYQVLMGKVDQSDQKAFWE